MELWPFLQTICHRLLLGTGRFLGLQSLHHPLLSHILGIAILPRITCNLQDAWSPRVWWWKIFLYLKFRVQLELGSGDQCHRQLSTDLPRRLSLSLWCQFPHTPGSRRDALNIPQVTRSWGIRSSTSCPDPLPSPHSPAISQGSPGRQQHGWPLPHSALDTKLWRPGEGTTEVSHPFH